ncbi:hypothetical protein FGO68_gene3857 [Halteria grandinella]|uniref:Uncharacterized protein n=1 Tax=Halteria grandinella TaxID=5974 RepID=A0A8J8NCH8_HALGN|nr:hypothetical protein FGO68_gene3857 [Halteria grandinella]
MNQWIFLVDSYGMSPEVMLDHHQHMQSSGMLPRKDESGFQVLDKTDASSGGIFQPSITRFMQSSTWQFYDQRIMGQEREPTVEEYVRGSQKPIEQRKSSIQIERNDYDKDQVLETFAIGLQLSLNVLNTERTEIDKANFEGLIEKDFIEFEQAPGK